MKKILCLMLSLVCLISTSVVYAQSGNGEENGALMGHSVDDIDVGAGYGMSYRKNGKFVFVTEETLTGDNLEYILEIASEKELKPANEEIHDIDKITDAVELDILTKNGEGYLYKFTEDRVYVQKNSFSDGKPERSYGVYVYRDAATYDEMMKFLEEIEEENKSEEEKPTEEEQPTEEERPTEEEKPEYTNAVNTERFKILYESNVRIKEADAVKWGVCTYVKEDEKKPEVAFYWNFSSAKDYELYSVSDDIENNTVWFENERILKVFKEDMSGVEYDNENFNFTADLGVTVKVNKDYTADDIAVIIRHRESKDNYEAHTISYTQKGELPEKYFKVDEDEKPTEIIENNKAEKNEDDEGENKTDRIDVEFSDVPKEHWAYDEILSLAEAGIILGYGNGSFGVNDYVTYEQFALLLDRVFDYEMENKSKASAIREDVIAELVKAAGIEYAGSDEKEILNVKFSDCSDVKNENIRYLAAAVKEELAVGSYGRLYPKDNLTRAEAAKLLHRAMNSV